MRLEEIRQKVEQASQAIAADGTPYDPGVWEEWPRVAYGDLPKSLQVAVRKSVSPQTLYKSLADMFGHAEFASLMESYLAETCPQLGDEPQEQYEKRKRAKVEQLMVKTRNAAVYIIHKRVHMAIEVNEDTNQLEEVEVEELVPELYGNHMQDALEAVLFASHPKERSEKPMARLASAGSRQMLISDKDYSGALVPNPNKKAYIAKMTPELLDKVRKSKGGIQLDDADKSEYATTYEDVKDLDLPILNQIWTATVRSGISSEEGVVTVDFAKFVKEMGIDASAGSAQDVIAKINEFSGFVGVMPEAGKIQALLTFMGYDKQSNTLKLGVPFMLSVLGIVERKNLTEKTTRTGKQYTIENPHFNELCHSTIAKERNKAAVYIVYEITNRLLQRGTTNRRKDGLYEYSVEFRNLVNAIPLLRGRVSATKRVSDQNKMLKRAFERAYVLLETKTDIHDQFAGLRYTDYAPTMATLDDLFIATFEKKNRLKPRR